jgi:hypothetical protein
LTVARDCSRRELLDIIASDAVAFRPREVSRVHLQISCRDIDGNSVFFASDLWSTMETFIDGERTPSAHDGLVDAAKPIADQDIIGLGPSDINVFIFCLFCKNRNCEPR